MSGTCKKHALSDRGPAWSEIGRLTMRHEIMQCTVKIAPGLSGVRKQTQLITVTGNNSSRPVRYKHTSIGRAKVPSEDVFVLAHSCPLLSLADPRSALYSLSQLALRLGCGPRAGDLPNLAQNYVHASTGML